MSNIGSGVIFAGETVTGVDKDKAKEWSSVNGYYDMLSDAYLRLVGESGGRSVVVDASCGVGGLTLPCLIDRVNKKAVEQRNSADSAVSDISTDSADSDKSKKLKVDDCALHVTILNNVGEGELNEQCGAEYVQKGRQPPQGWTADNTKQGVNLCSYDGDGDRLVYHFFDNKGGTMVHAQAQSFVL